MITLPENLYIAVDIAIALIFVVCIIKALVNGFLYELVSLVGLILAIYASWFLAPVMAENMSLLKLSELDNPLVDLSNIKLMINTILWFVILFIVINIIIMIIKPLFKFIQKVPLIGFINKLLGFLIGIIEGLIVTLIMSLILTTPLFTNGSDIKKNTSLNYISVVSDEISKSAYKNIFENIIKDKDIDIDTQRELLTNWLTEQGIFDE